MKRREFLQCFSAAALSALPFGLASANGNRPNVVFFYIDDLGWKDVAFMGGDFYETPNVDRLAEAGMTFTSAYANAPNCAPSRACLLTGLYSPRHRVYTVGSAERGRSKDRKLIPIQNTTTLDPAFVTIAEVFQRAGYATAHVGKWHLGRDPQSGPRAQGYAINIGGNRRGHPPTYFSPYSNPNLKDGPEGEYLTERLAKEGRRFIEANKGGPFFLMMSLYAVHTPLQAKEPLIRKYRNKAKGEHHNHPVYAAMLEGMDQAVGHILDTLDEQGLTENTLVVFTSDNGGYGPVTSMHPLRGAKGMLYEGGIRVPMAVRWPGRVEPGSRCDEPVIGVDFMPTVLDLLNAEPPAGQPLDGKSLMPVLTQNQRLNREALYWHFPAYLQAYRDTTGPWRTTPAGGIRQGDYKLLEFFESGTLELYNLAEDIGENRNLAKETPELTQSLHELLIQWREKTNAPVPSETNPDYTGP